MVPRELAAEMKKIDLRSPAYLGRLARWTRAHASIVEGLYTSPLHPAAQDHAAAVLGEIAAKYPIDGVHLDYIRFPNEDFDYSPSAMDQFKASILPDLTDRERREAAAREALDPAAYPNLFPERWSDFRRSRLTSLVIKFAPRSRPRGRARSSAPRSCRTHSWRSPAGCRIGAGGSTSRCST